MSLSRRIRRSSLLEQWVLRMELLAVKTVVTNSIATIMIFMCLVFVVSIDAVAADKGNQKRYRIYWPNLALASNEGERIESVDILMSCGRFRGIANIPNDWSVEIASPSSEQTKFHAYAGHGASRIWSLRELDGSVLISVAESSCFDISAVVTTEVSGNIKKHEFSQAHLHLRP